MSIATERRQLATADDQVHLSTGHLMAGLKGRTVSSGIVTGLAQVTLATLNLVSVVVLARLLTPQDFGLVAMVATVMGFLRPFSEAGLSAATIQRPGITSAQVSNLFWTNVLLGVVLALTLSALAPTIAWFYSEPRLVVVTLWLSSTFLLAGATVQHMALLGRQMRFKAIACIQVASAAGGTLVGMTMAALNCGHWCLVGMGVSTPFITLLLTWSASRWRPELPSRANNTRSLLRFGANLTASRFVWSLARGSDGLLIGRYFGLEALGLYSRGMVLVNRPLEQAMAPLEAVFVPTFSRLQVEPERYRRVVLQVFDAIAVAGFLFSGFLLVLAHPLTLVVLGPKWAGAAPILTAFSLVAIYVPLTSAAGWLLISQGRSRDFLRLSAIASVVTLIFFLLGLRFGPVGVAMSYSLSCLLVHLPVAFHVVGKEGVVTSRDLWRRFFVHLPLWVVVCAATWLVKWSLTDEGSWTQLLWPVAAGLATGAAFIGLYHPSRHVVVNLFGAWQEWRSV